MPNSKYIVSHAVLSEDGLYRYVLIRKWDLWKPVLMLVMMNPSTANAEKDDATIRSCVRLAKGLGFGGIVVCNLFAWRSTDPKKVPHSLAEAVGSENDAWLELMALQANQVVAAWGALVGTRGLRHTRVDQVVDLLTRQHDIHAFVLTEKGHPGHPLYLKSGTEMQVWRPKLTRDVSSQLEAGTFGP